MATGAPMATITATNMCPPMTTDLTLAQWFSPAFPVGAFAYSHGLESAIDTRRVHDAQTLRDWIEMVLTAGSGRNDALLLAASYHAEDPAEIDAIARAFAASAERLQETVLQGEAFAKITTDVWGLDVPGFCYPVATGRAARLCDLPLEATTSYFLHAFVSTLCSVGMRLIPLGQTDGHRIIQALAPLCLRIAKDTGHGDLEQLSATAYLADIDTMHHETQHSRTFRT